DRQRLAPLRRCMMSSGPEHPADAWQHSCIHPAAVAYSCGRLARPGGPNEHDHVTEDIGHCRRLAAAAGAVCRGLEVSQSEDASTLDAFCITANRSTPVPDCLTARVVRTAFGGTIYSRARIAVAPLRQGNRGWQAIADSEDGELHLPRGSEDHFSPEQ